MPRWVKVSVPDPQGLQKALPPERDHHRGQGHHRTSPTSQRILAAIPATSSGSEGEDAITGVRRHHHHHHHHRRRPRIAVQQSSPPPSKRRLVYGLAVMVIVVMVSCCLAFLLSGTESLWSSPSSTLPSNVTSANDSHSGTSTRDVPDYHENHSLNGEEETSSETVISRVPNGPRKDERDPGDFFADLMADSSPVESVNRPVVVKRNWTNAHGQTVTDGRSKSQVRYADRTRVTNVELSRRQFEDTNNKRQASKSKGQSSTANPQVEDKGRAFRERWIHGPPSLRGVRLPIDLPTRRGPVPAIRPGILPRRPPPPLSGVSPYGRRPSPRPYGSRQEPIVRPELIEFFEKNPHLLEKLLNDTVSQAEAAGAKGDLPPIDLLSWMTSEYYSFVENQSKPSRSSSSDGKVPETKMDRAGMPVAGRQIMPLPPPPPGWRRRPVLIARRAEGRRIPIILPPPSNFRRRPVRQEPAALRDSPERPRSRRKKHSLYSYPASASSIQDILQYLKNEYGTSSTSHREYYDEHPDTYAQGYGYRNGYSKAGSKHRNSHVSYVEDEGIPLYEDDEEFGPDMPQEDERRFGGKMKSQSKRPFEVMLDVYPVKNKPSSSSSTPTAAYNPDDYYRQDASQHSQSGRDRSNGHHVVLHLNLYSKKPSGSPSYYRKRRRLFDADEQEHRDSQEYDTSSSVSTPGNSPGQATLPSSGWAEAIPQTDTTTTTDATDHAGTAVPRSSVQTTTEPQTTSGTSGELPTSGSASSSPATR